MTNREAFEAWAEKEGYVTRKMLGSTTNEYAYLETEQLWDAWHAATKHLEEELRKFEMKRSNAGKRLKMTERK